VKDNVSFFGSRVIPKRGRLFSSSLVKTQKSASKIEGDGVRRYVIVNGQVVEKVDDAKQPLSVMIKVEKGAKVSPSPAPQCGAGACGRCL